MMSFTSIDSLSSHTFLHKEKRHNSEDSFNQKSLSICL